MKLSKEAAIHKMNALAMSRTPFLFIIDYKCEQNQVLPLDEVNPEEILYDINGDTNVKERLQTNTSFDLTKSPVDYPVFKNAFDAVHKEIELGNSYLVNLTFPTSISCNHNLREIFDVSKAKYKLWLKDQFVVFSPEIFVKIEGNEISSFPMKGTIDAGLPNAAEQLLGNSKEMAEHVTIVDLIRNDMSLHADGVRVNKFRYLDEVATHEKKLLQASSQVKGDLKKEASSNLGDLMFSLLPAGSISGAPKPKTLEIIDAVENYQRGFYTGIFGIFDGKNLDSGVMIRFIEETKEGLVFKSGGGIHFMSNPEEEYQELIDKVYVPIH